MKRKSPGLRIAAVVAAGAALILAANETASAQAAPALVRNFPYSAVSDGLKLEPQANLQTPARSDSEYEARIARLEQIAPTLVGLTLTEVKARAEQMAVTLQFAFKVQKPQKGQVAGLIFQTSLITGGTIRVVLGAPHAVSKSDLSVEQIVLSAAVERN